MRFLPGKLGSNLENGISTRLITVLRFGEAALVILVGDSTYFACVACDPTEASGIPLYE